MFRLMMKSTSPGIAGRDRENQKVKNRAVFGCPDSGPEWAGR